MMRFITLVAALGAVLLFQSASSGVNVALAFGSDGADVTSTRGTFLVKTLQEGRRREQGPIGNRSDGNAPAGEQPRIVYVRACALGGEFVCDSAASCNDTGRSYNAYALNDDGRQSFFGRVCRGGTEVAAPTQEAPPQVTNAMVLRALRRVEVPSPRLVVQPPGGKTLVNLETIFSTNAEPFSASVRLVGRRVDLEIEPVGFVWSHGDGTSQRSTEPGRAYAEGVAFSEYLTHVYTAAGVTVHPRVSVEYGARFRVDGGRWRDVNGTVTVEGDPVDLRVVEGRPQLVNAY